MTEKPLLFSPSMVRAVLARRKWQTRRVVKPQPPTENESASQPYSLGPALKRGLGLVSLNDYANLPKEPGVFDVSGSTGFVRDACGQSEWTCPYGVPGDRLWVREAFRLPAFFNDATPAEYVASAPGSRMLTDSVTYLADGDPLVKSKRGRYRHARFMPRALSRLTLELTDVRVERVQDISEHDAWAEGVDVSDHARTCDDADCAGRSYRSAFASLWNEINGEASWTANPYVWALSFSVTS